MYLVYSTKHLTLTSLPQSIHPLFRSPINVCEGVIVLLSFRCGFFFVCLFERCFRAGASVEVGFGFCQLPLSSHCTFRWTPRLWAPHRKPERHWIEQTHTWSPFTSTDRLAETEHYSARWQIDSESWGDGALKSIRAIFMTVCVYIYFLPRLFDVNDIALHSRGARVKT